MLEVNTKTSYQSISKKRIQPGTYWMEVKSVNDCANTPADTSKTILRTRRLKLHYSTADVSVCIGPITMQLFRSLSYRRRLPADRLTSPVISWSAQYTFQQTITSPYNNRIRTPLCGQADRRSFSSLNIADTVLRRDCVYWVGRWYILNDSVRAS